MDMMHAMIQIDNNENNNENIYIRIHLIHLITLVNIDQNIYSKKDTTKYVCTEILIEMEIIN